MLDTGRGFRRWFNEYFERCLIFVLGILETPRKRKRSKARSAFRYELNLVGGRQGICCIEGVKVRKTGLPGCTEDLNNPLCADVVKRRGRPSSPAEIHDPPNAAHFSIVLPVLVTPSLRIILLLLHTWNFATITNHIVNIYVFRLY